MSSGIEAALTMVSVGLMAPGAAPTRTAADGTFTMTAVAPGDYLLVARSAAGRGAAPVGSVRWAQTEVLVDGADIEGVRLTLLSGVTLAGRVMPAGPEALPAGMPLSVTLVPAGAQGVSVVSEPQVDPSGRFAIENVLPGRYRVRASLGSWGLEAAALGETDVADVLLEITDGVDRDGLALRFLPRLGSVSGTLYDGANRPSNDLFVLLFPVNRADWFEDSRRMRAPVRTASDGRFAFDDLPAGEYCLAALADFDNAEWHTLGFLEAVLPAATRIAVAAGQVTQQDVRVAGGG
jgi:hypothetical protein